MEKILTQDGFLPWWVTQLVIGAAEVQLELYCENLPNHRFLVDAAQFIASLEADEEGLRNALGDDIARHYGHMAEKSGQLTNALLASDMALKRVARWHDGDFLLTYQLTRFSFSEHQFVIGEFDLNHRLNYSNLS